MKILFLTLSLLIINIFFIYNCEHNINIKNLNKKHSNLLTIDKMPAPDSIAPLLIQITMDSFPSKKTYPLYEEEWNKYKFDYYYLKLNLINYNTYLFKIPLVARKMPILFEIGKNNNETFYLNEVQLYNTTWRDSVVFKKTIKENYYPFEAYQIGSYHNGKDVICPMEITLNKDTIDITNLNKKSKCHERERSSI